ncbi:single-stranded DNA-binding protein [Helicobacter ailurogastricus]|uniref:Single-stranded DNA-binding protein n=1 Tax=Helicobacter ailurogastricus TaxID=1578720 RepID=A0A0K2XZL7_9HELI|nr:single-stranded DNA-binding protein [Helicobacter ailurogastricus]CRF52113.1 Single-stranded DNA-binding protein [Helicobacter ailurogastricus]BDQ29232.1 single-stranded DNA-binding protein [Helicobacter ailurogastricus]GLH57906.1 single-stranded DNA-binding protein [Helicobacter ailurogastricus]GLH59337.1 single-stranded DNA-binding protein [Helicobacter ailurogastricus]GMB90040.1 single-stranded DNA-binding protein [Helicobacter ailurogastricus]
MYNKITLVGHFTKDVEVRHLPSGSVVGSGGIATNHTYKKQDGSKEQETCFVDVTFFGRTAEIAQQYLHKGSKVLIEGRLKFESWTDSMGNKRSKHVVVAENLVMLDSKAQSAPQDYTQASQGYTQSYPQTSKTPAPKREEKIPEINVDDDMPF